MSRRKHRRYLHTVGNRKRSADASRLDPTRVAAPSVGRLLGCFTKPSFAVFTAMAVGMIAQTGRKTVCGMPTGAGLAQTWSHDRVHRFFARAVWSVDAVGLVVLDLVVAHLIPADAAIIVSVDDTAHRRRGKQDLWRVVDP